MSKPVGERKMIWVFIPGSTTWVRMKDETTTPMQTTTVLSEQRLYPIDLVEGRVTYIKSINTTWEAESGHPQSDPPPPPGT